MNRLFFCVWRKKKSRPKFSFYYVDSIESIIINNILIGIYESKLFFWLFRNLNLLIFFFWFSIKFLICHRITFYHKFELDIHVYIFCQKSGGFWVDVKEFLLKRIFVEKNFLFFFILPEEKKFNANFLFPMGFNRRYHYK